MNFSIEEKIATIYNCHKGHVIHGETQSEGTFGKAVSVGIDGIFIKTNAVRVEVNTPELTVDTLTLIVYEGLNGYSVSFKGFVATDHDLEEAARLALEGGSIRNVSRF